MCWSTNFPELAAPKTAKKPIKVYKVCKKRPNSDIIISYYMNHEYKVGETYRMAADFEVIDYDEVEPTRPYYEINAGFHSYSHEKTKVKMTYHYNGDDRKLIEVLFGDQNCTIDYFKVSHYDTIDIVRVECTIPEGSTYYENANGEIVSNAITIDSITTIE